MSTAIDPASLAADEVPPVLQVRDLNVHFRSSTRTGGQGSSHAVDGVSFGVRPGEVLAVVGESGCGKSITSLSIMGLQPRNARVTGSATLNGSELLGASQKELQPKRGKEIAMIFQEPMTSLNPVLTVGRQIVEVLRRHQGMSRHDARARAVELLELVGIPAAKDRVDAYPHQLSGGMRQRVMIAIAVACNPAVLVADEPTTALDVTVQAGILDVLKNLRERLGTAIVLITHDLGVVADIADRVMVMYAGRVVEQGTVDEFFARPSHPYTIGLLGAVLRPGRRGQRLTEIPGLVPRLSEQPDACTFADRCPLVTERCREERPALERVGDAAHDAACWHADESPELLARTHATGDDGPRDRRDSTRAGGTAVTDATATTEGETR